MDKLISNSKTSNPAVSVEIWQRPNGIKYVRFISILRRSILTLEASYIQELLNTLQGKTLDGQNN